MNILDTLRLISYALDVFFIITTLISSKNNAGTDSIYTIYFKSRQKNEIETQTGLSALPFDASTEEFTLYELIESDILDYQLHPNY